MLVLEIYTITYGVDIIIMISIIINIIITYLTLLKVPIIIYIDLFFLYKYLVKLGTIKEKRLIINIMALQEAYERGELTNIR